MGMDVYGLQPTAKVGEYFRNNVWWWHPLWDYVLEVAPWVGDVVKHGHYNDRDGLNVESSARLAVILTQELDAGRTAHYEVEYMASLDAMTDQTCWLCKGTGSLAPKFARLRRHAGRSRCHVCDGKGHVRPHATNYPFSAENVSRFRDFVAASGGFEIW